MSIINDKTKIKVLSLLTAPGCQLAKNTKESDKKELWENNKKALIDGTFIDNVRKTLIRYNQPPYQIEGVEFWGQEPTLTLPYISEHWNEWMDVFPNIQYCFFSTNGIADSDIIYDFLMAVDEHSIHPFKIGIQIS